MLHDHDAGRGGPRSANASILKEFHIVPEFGLLWRELRLLDEHGYVRRPGRGLGDTFLHIAVRLHGVMPGEISQAAFQRFGAMARRTGRIVLPDFLEHLPRAAD